MLKNTMFVWILISITLAIICGVYLPKQMIAIQWIGQVFINLLKLIVLPLIFSALISAITSIGALKRLGSIGGYAMGYFLASVSIAVIIGLLLLNIFKPGVGIASSLILANATPMQLEPLTFSRYLTMLFPPNIVEAAAKYEIMPIVFFSIVFSLACLSVGKTAHPVIDFFVGLRDVLIKMIMWLMVLTPLGLFSLLGAAVAEASSEHLLLQSLAGMVYFILVFLAGLCLHMLWQTLLLAWYVKKSPLVFLKSAMQALLTAFATSSSMASLPATLLAAKNEKINDDVARFVLPLAATINLAGTAMYEAMCALFFCQILGFHLSLASQVGVFVTAILAGIGATGIPEGGLITMVMVLRAVSVPVSAIGLLLPFDRILDRFRTLTNVFGDLVCAATVDKMQGKPKRVRKSK